MASIMVNFISYGFPGFLDQETVEQDCFSRIMKFDPGIDLMVYLAESCRISSIRVDRTFGKLVTYQPKGLPDVIST